MAVAEAPGAEGGDAEAAEGEEPVAGEIIAGVEPIALAEPADLGAEGGVVGAAEGGGDPEDKDEEGEQGDGARARPAALVDEIGGDDLKQGDSRW